MISIIIPVYNTGESAKELVGRLLTDRCQDFEVILVDDGSRDDSLSILRKVAREDKRIRVLTQKNAGASAARNAGINISRGEYLCFIDSDDMVAENYLYKMVNAMKKHQNAAFVVCGRRYHRVLEGSDRIMNVEPLRPRRAREKLADYIIYMLVTGERIYSSIDKIYHAEIIRENKIRFEEKRDFAEDTNFVLNYLKYALGDIICLNEPLYIYYYGTETSTVRKSALKWENWERQYADTVDFARKTSGIGPRTFVLLRLLRLRWRVSQYRAKKRARKAARAKD